MKTQITFIIIFLWISINTFAQRHDRPPRDVPEKILQLEKIKLIETLEMDEETTLKFFSRRAEHKKTMDEIADREESLIIQIENILNGDNEASENELKKLIIGVDSIQSELAKSKSEFISSLDDLLTTEQIAKLIVFERRFREELRGVLFRDRKFKNRY